MDEILSRLPAPMQLNESILVIAAIFLVLLVILNTLVFKPLMSVLDEREKKIMDGEEAAKQAQKTVEESLAAYTAKKASARQEAQAQRQKMLAEVEQTRSEMVDKAKVSARSELDKCAAEVSTKVDQAKVSLTQDSRGLAEQIAATILSRA